MSELMNSSRDTSEFRWRLLCGASAFALIASAPVAIAGNDSDRPIVWIELGGQLERIDSAQKVFAPPFFSSASPDILAPLIDSQRQPLYSTGENGKISFQPEGSDWLVSASIRYGRSSAAKHSHYETARTPVPQTIFGRPAVGHTVYEFGDGQGASQESHFVIDFQAGKDVGLGLFGVKGTSVVGAGVRFAQFTADAHATLHARPYYQSGPFITVPGFAMIHDQKLRDNTAIMQSRRDARAVGPSVFWDASVPFAGNTSDSELTFDWGVNAAVLFGRQRTRVHHQTSGNYFYGFTQGKYITRNAYVNPPVDRIRSRRVTIPNVGGFAGISFRYADAKVSFGYRGDFFFNAMDTGWDTRKSSTLGFYGPYASISIGIGD